MISEEAKDTRSKKISIWTNSYLLTLVGGELLGALALEAFNITIIWHIVKGLGVGGAYYLAGILFGAILSGLIGGGLLDRYLPFRTAATINAVRVLVAAFAVIAVLSNWPSVVLVAASLGMSIVRPHLDAAIFSGLSTLKLDDRLLEKANALVDNTSRFARILGPGLAAAIATFSGEKTVLLFSCVGFFLAAILLALLDIYIKRIQTRDFTNKPKDEKADFFSQLTKGYRIAAASPLLMFCFVSQSLNAGAWYLGFVFSTALLFSSNTVVSTGGLGGFGTATLFYGLGNVLGNFATSSTSIVRPINFVILGRFISSIGYLLMAMNFGFHWLFFCAMIAAAGTPPSDLAFLKILQTNYAWEDISKLYRVKLVSEYAGMLLAMFAAPVCIQMVGPHGVIAGCGLVLLCCSSFGLWLLSKKLVVDLKSIDNATPTSN